MSSFLLKRLGQQNQHDIEPEKDSQLTRQTPFFLIRFSPRPLSICFSVLCYANFQEVCFGGIISLFFVHTAFRKDGVRNGEGCSAAGNYGEITGPRAF